MIEVEIKLPIKDRNATAEQLAFLNFHLKSRLREEDTYYDNAERQIVNSRQALRIRQVTNLVTGEISACTTFKSRRLDAVSSTRREYETKIGDARTFSSILSNLGYFPVEPEVIKVREEYTLPLNEEGRTVNACLDQVEHLGSFLELEIVIEDGESREAALSELEEILKKLGYRMEDTTTRSYLAQLQTNPANAGFVPGTKLASDAKM